MVHELKFSWVFNFVPEIGPQKLRNLAPLYEQNTYFSVVFCVGRMIILLVLQSHISHKTFSVANGHNRPCIHAITNCPGCYSHGTNVLYTQCGTRHFGDKKFAVGFKRI